MFDLYQDIFHRRGAAYHAAMELVPWARADEFKHALAGIPLQSGQTVCDIPSGGGYLGAFIATSGVNILAVENTDSFYAKCKENPRVTAIYRPLEATGIDSAAVDYVISLAGLHHAADRQAVFHEMYRIARPGGRICVADVIDGSDVALFLDEYVDANNSMGHVGDFLGPHWIGELEAAGFRDVWGEEERYTWNFSDEAEMGNFCRLLFGIDMAPPERISEAIGDYLGYETNTVGCRMNWGLAFLRGRKPF
jgi:SAM-dependent methyltransferase